ncbi:MAG: D-alanyl-D-alanine carboxypeptidase/D-alanyl-D-alanine-endopeptidase [SAR324 cluster bacterium]|nr:D-alanyl-D-alanine carboxypeptidase/D-alanyl-D-alanine-endopeptidase [SAR324 cluster bacterium]
MASVMGPAAVRAVALPLVFAVLLCGGPAAWAHTPKTKSFAKLHKKIDRLLERTGLDSENTALMLFSTRRGRFLYRLREQQPMIAASNAKLVTAYASLRVLGPNYRWKTVFYRVTEQDDAGGRSRQGLLVKGGGDPTLTLRTLERIALKLKTKNLRRIEGGLYFDASLFDHVKFPAAWGSALGGQAWFAPVSPFIVEKNTANFVITAGKNGNGIEVIPEIQADFLKVTSRLKSSPVKRAVVRVLQSWNGEGALFTFRGKLPAKSNTYRVSTAVNDPVVNFYHHLRSSLHRIGIEGDMPRRRLPAGGMPSKRIHTHYSAPLRELLVDVNKESNNLAAEVMVRTMGMTRKTKGVTGADGLKVLRAALFEELPKFKGKVEMADGSGLSRDTRLSASFLVHMLNRVLRRQDFRAEYLSSLSLAGWDGTLRYRNYPKHMRGQIRAKSGTLAGVQNLSGYLTLKKDVVVFSFLINDSDQHYLKLQAKQDRALAGVFDALLEWENPKTRNKSKGKRRIRRRGR